MIFRIIISAIGDYYFPADLLEILDHDIGKVTIVSDCPSAFVFARHFTEEARNQSQFLVFLPLCVSSQ